MQNAHALALVPLALSLAATTSAQGEVVWSDHYQPPQDRAFHQQIVAHPHGGAVATMRADSANSPYRSVEVRRLNENGDRLWTVTRPDGFDPVTQDPLYVVGASVSPNGDVLVLANVDDHATVDAFDAGGSHLWSRTIFSVVTGADFDASAVGFTASGDAYVVGVQLAPNLQLLDDRVSVVLLDAATGQQTWRRDVFGNDYPIVAFGAGDAFVSFPVLGVGPVVERFDDTGATLYRTGALLPFSGGWRDEFMVADDQGNLAIGFWKSSPFRQRILSVDPGGATAWNTSVAAATILDEGVITSNGDVVAKTGQFGTQLVRLDTQGSVLWTRPQPPLGGGYRGLSATDDDGVVAIVNPSTFPNGPSAQLERVDAAGNTTDLVPLGYVSAREERVEAVAVDSRGNAWVGITLVGAAARPDGARTSKVVLGGDPSTPYCMPTVLNSTGWTSELKAAGADVVSADNLTLVARQLPPNAALFALNSRTPGFAPGAGGSQGTLCLGGSIGRYVGPGQIRRADAVGRASLQLTLAETPTPTGLRPVVAGETWRFQVWHRDLNPTPTSNFTNGIAITFQ